MTLGDGGRRSHHSKTSGTLKRPFYFKDTCKTPYCCRTLLVIFSGLILIGSGTIMTLTGYKPALLLPWYAEENNVTSTNETNEESGSEVLGEPGPLRIMVYTGPILMGVGFFGVMMAVVLFCEIKDRYLMAILPTKGQVRKIKKDILYDIIISEFRKNYFRGIEVPIKKEERKKSSSKKWSFSLSGSGSSFISFARRHSHDLFKLVKRKQKAKEKWINATFPKRSTPDYWMKTSSLPNIKHKAETVELEILPPVNQTVMVSQGSNGPTDVHMTGVADLDETNVSGVDNLAYRDSPSNKKTKIPAKAVEYIPETLTTVVIHNVSKPNEVTLYNIDNSYQNKDTTETYSNSEADEDFKDSFTEINKCMEDSPEARNHKAVYLDKKDEDQNNMNNYGKSKTEEDDSTDALGMTSGTSSLTMSWEGDPLEWSDARRNTEPCAVFQLRLDSTSSESNDDIMQTTTQQLTTTTDDKTLKALHDYKRNPCTFKTLIRVFHSETSLSKPNTFTQQIQGDTLSIDSLELTDEMLKKFEMAQISHI